MLRLLRKITSFTATRGQGSDADRMLDYRELPVMTAEELFAFTKQQTRLRNIKRIVQIDDTRYRILYQEVIERFAELVQLMPASQAHHHAVPGGLFIHTVEVLEHALTLRQQYKLPLLEAQEIQEAQRHLWTYAIFAAAILHDVGKRLTLGRFVLNRDNRFFDPFAADIGKLAGQRYQIVFHQPRYHKMHEQMGLAFMAHLFPRVGLDFLLPEIHVMKELLAYIHGNVENDGSIGLILRLADQASTGHSLAHSDSRKFASANLENIGERLMTQLRLLLSSNHFVINRGNGNVYTSADGHFTYIVSKTLADDLRSTLAELGQKDIPSDNNRIFDIFQEYAFAETNPDTGQIIHYIRRAWGDKVQTFSVIKFRSNRLFRVPPPELVGGTITEVAGKSAEPSGLPASSMRPAEQSAVRSEAAVAGFPVHTMAVAAVVKEAWAPEPEKSPFPDSVDDAFPETGRNLQSPETEKRESANPAPGISNKNGGEVEPNEDPFGTTVPAPSPLIAEAAETGTASAANIEDSTDEIIDDVPSGYGKEEKQNPETGQGKETPATGESTVSTDAGGNADTVSAEHTGVVDAESDLSEQFLLWCREQIRKKAIVINQSSGVIQKVAYKQRQAIAVVTPRIFIMFGTSLGLSDHSTTVKRIQNAIHAKKLNIPAPRGQIHKFIIKKSESNPLGGNKPIHHYLFEIDKFCENDAEVKEIIMKTKNNGNLALC